MAASTPHAASRNRRRARTFPSLGPPLGPHPCSRPAGPIMAAPPSVGQRKKSNRTGGGSGRLVIRLVADPDHRVAGGSPRPLEHELVSLRAAEQRAPERRVHAD